MANDSATAGFVMNQTMLRVRDPDMSVAFYRDVLGMTELARYDFEEMQFSLYFMGYLADDEQIPEEVGERAEWLFARPALVELTHNWGRSRMRSSMGITTATHRRRDSDTSVSRCPTSMPPASGSSASGSSS